MAGSNSQAGLVSFGLQTVKGTSVATTRRARLRSGSIGGDRSLLIPDPEIGGDRDIQDAKLGPVGGRIVAEVFTDVLAKYNVKPPPGASVSWGLADFLRGAGVA